MAMDDAKAYRLARILEKYLIDQGHKKQAQLLKRVVEFQAAKVITKSRIVSSISKSTLALAILFDSPGLSDVEIARRARCSTRTLQRDRRYQSARAILRKSATLPPDDATFE